MRLLIAAADGSNALDTPLDKMKHLDIKEGWIQLLRDRDIAEFWKIEGPLNLADFLTKLNDRIIFDQQYAMIQYIKVLR